MWPHVLEALYEGGSRMTTQSRSLGTMMPGENPIALALCDPETMEPHGVLTREKMIWNAGDKGMAEMRLEDPTEVGRLIHMVSESVDAQQNVTIEAQAILWELRSEPHGFLGVCVDVAGNAKMMCAGGHFKGLEKGMTVPIESLGLRPGKPIIPMVVSPDKER